MKNKSLFSTLKNHIKIKNLRITNKDNQNIPKTLNRFFHLLYHMSLLSHIKNIRNSSLKIGRTKKTTERSALMQIQVETDEGYIPTTERYWVPNFMINEKGNIVPKDEFSVQKIRELRKMMIEKEKGCLHIIDRVRETDKSWLVRCVDFYGTEYEVWYPKKVFEESPTDIPKWLVDSYRENGRLTEVGRGEKAHEDRNIMEWIE